MNKIWINLYFWDFTIYLIDVNLTATPTIALFSKIFEAFEGIRIIYSKTKGSKGPSMSNYLFFYWDLEGEGRRGHVRDIFTYYNKSFIIMAHLKIYRNIVTNPEVDA